MGSIYSNCEYPEYSSRGNSKSPSCLRVRIPLLDGSANIPFDTNLATASVVLLNIPLKFISFSLPGISAPMTQMWAFKVKVFLHKLFQTSRTPLSSCKYSCTSGKRKNSKSFELFGPGIKPTSSILCFLNQIAGGIFRLT